MPWNTPDFVEISLCMEVTAYVNTDDKVGVKEKEPPASTPTEK
jgi:coenzyme PQQ precursor peptide PqqA